MLPVSVTAKSPIGAGDALLAGVVFAAGSGLGLETTTCWAVAAGTAAAAQKGTGMGEREKVERLVKATVTQSVMSFT